MQSVVPEAMTLTCFAVGLAYIEKTFPFINLTFANETTGLIVSTVAYPLASRHCTMRSITAGTNLFENRKGPSKYSEDMPIQVQLPAISSC